MTTSPSPADEPTVEAGSKAAAPDPVHPPGQSQAFSRALKRRGIPTQRVVYPSLSPKHMRSVTPRTVDWLDEHLGRHAGEESSR